MEKGPELFGEFHEEVLGKEPVPVEYDPLLQQLESTAETREDETLTEQLETLKEDCIRYIETILRLAVFSKRLSYDPERYRESVQNIDELRRRTHNVVIDDVNMISRAFLKRGLDNRWREQFSSRESIEEWAIHIALGTLSRELIPEAAAA
ncbi:MAG: hypothetical protein KJI72_02795 [Patescibacteria group bacterium]|nr:hypothetical protein [Patescibacteria group bacterium]